MMITKELMTIELNQITAQGPAYDRGTETNPMMTLSRQHRDIYLAGGCFWGVQAYFKQVHGIVHTEVGYANGLSEQASYEDLKTTGHAETVKITYNANAIHLAEILDRFFKIIDPFSLNQQGNDIGAQYRTGIFYIDETTAQIAKESLALHETSWARRSVVQIEPLCHFIPAETYHQDYLHKNPNGYCHIPLSQAQETLYPGKEKPSQEALKADLDDLSYRVTQHADTEAPHTSAYNRFDRPGIYVDITTGQPLFTTDDQFTAGCGWPSFTKPITTDIIGYYRDDSYGYQRIEVTNKHSDNHLGHVFPDGPVDDGGLRFCINGAALKFIAYEDLESAGYRLLKAYVQKR